MSKKSVGISRMSHPRSAVTSQKSNGTLKKSPTTSTNFGVEQKPHDAVLHSRKASSRGFLVKAAEKNA